MKTNKEKLNRLSGSLANKMMKKDLEGWPPDCPFGFYQPVRPKETLSSYFNEPRVTKKQEKA